MSLRNKLIECGCTPEHADSLLTRIQDDDHGVASNALQELCRVMTPMLLQTLRDILGDERARAELRKRGAA